MKHHSPKEAKELASQDHEQQEQPKAPLPPIVASNIPAAKEHQQLPPTRQAGDPPKDEEYSGLYTLTEGPLKGEQFALAIIDDNPDGRSHYLKNSLHLCNVTESDFKLQFEKA